MKKKVISTAVGLKMVSDVELRFHGRMDEIEKQLDDGLRRLNDKLALLINARTLHSRAVVDELRQLLRECINECSMVTNTPASAVRAPTVQFMQTSTPLYKSY